MDFRLNECTSLEEKNVTSHCKLSFAHPPARPGQTPDFSSVEIPKAGLLPVLPLDVTAADCVEHANSLIRVMDENGEAVGPWAEFLNRFDVDTLRAGLRDMMMSRTIDMRMMNAQRQGKMSFYIQGVGEEAIACGFQRCLKPGDMNFPTYRQQGLLIAGGYPLEMLLGQFYSNAFDPLQGRQLPTLHSARDYGYFTVSGNLGTQYVHAVGWAMANALTQKDNISIGWIGDGSTASNDFHTALLSASSYSPPVILNVVNNQWAISTYTGVAKGKGRTYAARALGYGIPAIRVDGNDYLAVLAVSEWATQRVRAGHGPVLIEWYTYRVGAHSSSDDPSAYRPRDEGKAWPFGDPIDRLKKHLIHIGEWSEQRHVQAEAEVLSTVVEVQKRVEAAGTMIDPKPIPGATIFKGVYADMPEHIRRQRQELGV
ncbi:thiamine pyrophosphate-dependent enzyme [Rhizobium rhizoryzae]|uniref:thiamine pyrophosphate-dependent enzyme n=1 Tax=Rhizobium rhizoryzae TaxID=451876 RepID=UPI0009EB8DD1